MTNSYSHLSDGIFLLIPKSQNDSHLFHWSSTTQRQRKEREINVKEGGADTDVCQGSKVIKLKALRQVIRSEQGGVHMVW